MVDEASGGQEGRSLGEAHRRVDGRSIVLAELDDQLAPDEAAQLREVLSHLAGGVGAALGTNLVGVYLTGSFALVAGDIHADVDFLVVTSVSLTADQEASVRALHAKLPDLPSHWARNLEGGYASVADLRKRADRQDKWLYVDNGNREAQWSAHDNTEVSRWVLRNRAIAITGPPPATLLDDIPGQALRDEVIVDAQARQRAVEEDPWIFTNAWGQPHVVLAWCRMLYTASLGGVTSKAAAAHWAITRLPSEWHSLIEHAVSDRPDPWGRVHRDSDPELAEQTRRFIAYVTPEIIRAAALQPGP